MVEDFQFLVTDDRYSVPSLLFAQAKDVDAARDLAGFLLSQHKHYRAVEVWIDNERLFTLPQADSLAA